MAMVSLGLEGKVVFVTGGNKGIGASVVGLLEDLGAKVAYTYRSGKGERGAMALQADVTDRAAMEKAVEQIEQELGPIFGIVANAGITRDKLFAQLSQEDWDAVIATNLTGVFNTYQPVVPKMYERSEGSLVVISSIVGQRGNPGQANYAATKAGVIAFAQTLAREGARYRVRSNVIAPGFIETEMLGHVPDKVKDRILQEIPLRRFGRPEEIAWAAVYLLSPVASSFVTGAVIGVNGGHYM
jgi:acetoacetyl-CoA reductase